MSILRVANLQFNASGTKRIDYDATNDDGIIKVSADAIRLPVGDTASRPNLQAGVIRYNSDLGLFEGANSTAWGSIGGVVDFATANGWANGVGVSANSYADAVGAAANSYAATMDTAGNNYTNAVGLAGNNYVNAVVFPAANTKLANATGTLAGSLSTTGTVTSNGYVYVTALDAGNEGGEIQLSGAGNYAGWSLDAWQNNHRVFVRTGSTLANINYFHALGGSVRMGINKTDPLFTLDVNGPLNTSSRGITKASMPAGSILQVVSVTDRQQSSYTTVDIGTNSNYGYNEAGFDLTTLDIALTPTSTSSRIFILTNINLGSWDQQYGVMRLKRGIGGATPTWSSSDPWMSAGNAVPGTATQLGSYIVTNRATGWQATHIHFQWLDSPNTTSEVKYRFNFRIEADATAATAYLNRAAYNTNDYGSTGAVSSVTLMEVAV